MWEEIRSNDFFWNRYTIRAALTNGAAFAKTQGDATRASTYSNAATAVSYEKKSSRCLFCIHRGWKKL